MSILHFYGWLSTSTWVPKTVSLLDILVSEWFSDSEPTPFLFFIIHFELLCKERINPSISIFFFLISPAAELRQTQYCQDSFSRVDFHLYTPKHVPAKPSAMRFHEIWKNELIPVLHNTVYLLQCTEKQRSFLAVNFETRFSETWFRAFVQSPSNSYTISSVFHLVWACNGLQKLKAKMA